MKLRLHIIVFKPPRIGGVFPKKPPEYFQNVKNPPKITPRVFWRDPGVADGIILPAGRNIGFIIVFWHSHVQKWSLRTSRILLWSVKYCKIFACGAQNDWLNVWSSRYDKCGGKLYFSKNPPKFQKTPRVFSERKKPPQENPPEY